MGFGDDIMGTGLAKSIMLRSEYADTVFVFGDPDNFYDAGTNTIRGHYSEVFMNNPHVLVPGEPVKNVCCIPDFPGQRSSIDYEKSDYEEPEEGKARRSTPGQIIRFQWNKEWSAPKGEIYFTVDEKSAASEIAMRLPYPYFVIEPNVADKPWFNHKGWPFDRWQDVVDAFPGVTFIQFNGQRVLRGVHQLITPTFRQAMGVLSGAGAFLGTDGGLHHAAAALDVPAIVLWGHYSSPQVFGYNDQVNLRHEDGLGCGYVWKECRECNESMLKISVDEVVDSFKELLHDGRDKISRKGADRPIFRMVGEAVKGKEE
tara:strand:- start:5081 stop:6025 length:945 start_codon:yes stop_codon:yes gene_type:complete